MNRTLLQTLSNISRRATCRSFDIASYKAQYEKRQHGNHYKKSFRSEQFAVISALFLSASVLKAKQEEERVSSGEKNPALPTYSMSEVSKHNSLKNRIWVVYKAGVYDITEFIDNHPGGRKILLAAGGRLEPFWRIYAQHDTAEVYEMLEEYRIGNLNEKDLIKKEHINADDPYKFDPKRHPALKVRVPKPFSAETPIELLQESYLTPNELFFVRNHTPVAIIDNKSYQFNVESKKGKKSLSLNFLHRNLPERTLIASLQCAGNRREDLEKFKGVKGIKWSVGAISTAKWTGVRLIDLLHELGFSDEELISNYEHIHFEGNDKGISGDHFVVSVPISKVVNDSDILLAYKMNDEVLSLDHGYPLRVIVPGMIAVKSVKWLKSIRLSKEEAPSDYQLKDYRKVQNPSEWSSSVPIYEFPVQCAITDPSTDSDLDNNEEITVSGYAISGGGNAIVRVDVSIDGGSSWHRAELKENENSSSKKQYGWTLFEVNLPLDGDKLSGKQIEIIAKATDSHHNTQPEFANDSVWNFRGLINNCWHRVKVYVP